MKRFESIALAIVSACAALALSACGSSAAETPAATGADATVTDAPGATDTQAPKDTASTDTTAAPDVAKDVPPAKPCNGTCKANETCDSATNKCISACVPACKAGENCVASTDGKTFSCAAQACKFPDKWGPNLQKISKLAITDVTKGCDLDGDGKPNNVLGKVVSLYKDANTQLAKTVADGTIVLILEAPGFKTDKTPFDINLLIGKFDKAATPPCDPTTATCNYTIDPVSYDTASALTGFCPSLVTFPGAKDDNGSITTTGKDVFQLNVPVVGMNLNLKITQASMLGTTTDATTWKDTKSGMICGVISKDDLNAAIDAIPADVLAQIGDAATVKSLVAGILKPDIALTPGGPKDALSVAIDFETIPANVTGMYVKP